MQNKILRGWCVIYQQGFSFCLHAINSHLQNHPNLPKSSSVKMLMACSSASLVRARGNPVAVLDPLHPPAHQAGKDRHHHFLIDLHQIFRESVDASADLPRHRDGIPVGKEAHTPTHKLLARNRKIEIWDQKK